jgi:hypothetical protein
MFARRAVAKRRVQAVSAEVFDFGDIDHGLVLRESAPTPALPRERERERAAVVLTVAGLSCTLAEIAIQAFAWGRPKDVDGRDKARP